MKLSPEEQNQAAFTDWCRANAYRHLALEIAYFTMNGAQAASMGGASKGQRFGAISKLKRLGMVAGIPDFCIPFQPPLYIEFKSQNGRLSEAQREVQRDLKWLGCDVHNAFTVDSAIAKTEERLKTAVPVKRPRERPAVFQLVSQARKVRF